MSIRDQQRLTKTNQESHRCREQRIGSPRDQATTTKNFEEAENVTEFPRDQPKPTDKFLDSENREHGCQETNQDQPRDTWTKKIESTVINILTENGQEANN